MDEKVRTIEVEFLRPGPPHNQLLSPLTQYLAVCGDAGAGTVTVPFEHAAFNRRLSNLRYQLDDEEDESRRLEVLRNTGGDLGAVLNNVPGLIGSLAERSRDETLLNLRIITSASELALLPFELAKVPSSAGRPSDEWLALRPGTPVCISRRVRSVTPSHQPWPRERPKVLFIVGLGIEESLRDAHHDALYAALRHWRRVAGEAGGDEGHEPLVVLEGDDATMPRIRRQLKAGFTAIHILAHGAETQNAKGERYGLLLKGTGHSDGDVVTGERFASAFRSIPSSIPLPSTIVAASCDSGYQADLLIPGGSFAQALHLIGIPLVIASQFPLTFDGSIRLAQMFFEEVLWGKNPLPAIADLRAALHSELGNTHDWASLVVYDALPSDLDDQLEEVRYYRARYAIDDALRELDQVGEADDEGITKAEQRAEPALQRLPPSPRFAMEVGGLRGSYTKRMSQHLFADRKYSEARQKLEIARREYREASNRFYSTGGATRSARLNWLETQAISLSWILGDEPETGSWEIAMRSCQRDLADGDFRAQGWAHSSLAELYLLRLFDAGDDELEDIEQLAKDHVGKLLEYYPRAADFPVFATRRQFNRYVNWWGSDTFVKKMGHRARSRSARWTEVNKLAAQLVELLDTAIHSDEAVDDIDSDDSVADAQG